MSKSNVGKKRIRRSFPVIIKDRIYSKYKNVDSVFLDEKVKDIENILIEIDNKNKSSKGMCINKLVKGKSKEEIEYMIMRLTEEKNKI